MASLIEYQQQQISKLEDKVENLTNLIGNLQSGCELRHKIDLALQLTRLSKDLENLTKRVEDIENDSEINEQQAIEFEKRFTELKAQVNIIILKIDNITNLSQKSKDTKTNFFIQLMVIILSAIILGVVGFIWSHAWNSISYKLNSNTSSPNNIQSSIASTSD